MSRVKRSPAPHLITHAEINAVPGVSLRLKKLKKGDSLYACYRTPLGTQPEVPLGTTRDECVENLKGLAVMLGVVVERNNPKDALRVVAVEWLAVPKVKADGKPYSEQTIRTYCDHYNAHILPQLGDKPVKSITKAVVQAWMNNMRKGGAKPDTVNKSLFALRHILDHAQATGRVFVNAARQVKPMPTPDTHLDDYITHDEVDALAAEIVDHYEAHVLALGYTGLRISELAGVLRSDCIVHENGAVSIMIRRCATKTDAGARLVFVPEPAATAVRRLKTVQDSLNDPCPYLFQSAEGGQLVPNRFRRPFRTAVARCLKAGVIIKKGKKNITPHTLRHCALTAFASSDANLPLQTLTSIAGHKKSSTTFDRYVGTSPEMLRQAADAISRSRTKETA